MVAQLTHIVQSQVRYGWPHPRYSGAYMVSVLANLSSFSVKLASRTLVAALVSGGIVASALAQEAKPAAKLDLVKGQSIASQTCAACHAADGNSTSPANPKLAGQHADYLAKQLQNFKVKTGAKEAERGGAAAAPMAGIVAALSAEDMRNVSAYLATQTLKPASAKSNRATVALGEKIYRGGIAEKNVPACAGCHSPNGAGIPAQYPRLQGQWVEYTDSQLKAFRANTRKNSSQMSTIAARLSDAEIAAVADYIAGLR
jgi:cytochrome c553